MNKRHTRVQVHEQIVKLREIRTKVQPMSLFRENHHAAIDAQVEVLKERLTASDVFDRADERNWPNNARDAALEAADWLAGETSSEYADPATSWQDLVAA